MGAGASVEGEIRAGPSSNGSVVTGVRSPHLITASNTRSVASTRSIISQKTWKKVSVPNNGPKSPPNMVVISRNGFSTPSITISEGQIVVFAWDDPSGIGYNVIQVIHDGEQFRPVSGGIYSGAITKEGHYEHQFNLSGEYKFVSAGLRCTPLLIVVNERNQIVADLTDIGFSPRLIHIEQGTSVKWQWNMLDAQHMMHEVKFCPKHCSVMKSTSGSGIATTSGSFKQEFKLPGLYYFQAEAGTSDQKKLTMVHVVASHKEHKIDVQDSSFSPMILLIEEGDRVWWSWSKATCNKYHCIYQIEPPSLDHNADESFKQKKDGFRWQQPSRCGLISHEFKTPGVFYYSDHGFHEAAEYIGTIIVRPKQKDLIIELSPEGFSQDLVHAETGDRIWWSWKTVGLSSAESVFSIVEVERCLTPITKDSSATMCDNKCQFLDDYSLHTKSLVGFETTTVNSVGVYHFRIADSPNNISTSSILVNPGSRNYTIHVSDKGFDPKVLSIHTNDRVWWVWQSGAKQHNIIQVSHQGLHVKNGFCSGATMDCPSAFVHQFTTPGVFYYISSNIPKVFGAVVVSSQPRVHDVMVETTSIRPDPVVINTNDVVCWLFKGLRQNDVQKISSVDQLLDMATMPSTHAPRRCMNKSFSESGVFHFCSKAFLRAGNKDQTEYHESRVSSVVVDESHDCVVVQVSTKGFNPSKVNILQGQSILWAWKNSGDEEHNIVHVNPPNTETPLSVIQGTTSFNSGKPVPSNSFLYTFDEEGSFCVASQGAPGYAGTVQVLTDGEKTASPEIVSEKRGGVCHIGDIVKLDCITNNAEIFYTLDGSMPEPHCEQTKTYKPDKGIVLKDCGFVTLRASAVSDSCLQSETMTSRHFLVLSKLDGDEDESEESAAESEIIEPKSTQSNVESTTKNWRWWGCIPKIKACFTGPGMMEIFWDPPPDDSIPLVRGYQIHINSICYCEIFPSMYHSLNIAGLAGGRTYEIWLEVHPEDEMFLPHKSNYLTMYCDKTTSLGGPLISLGVTENDTAMAIIWMAVSSKDFPVEGYKVYLNGKQCGGMVVPDDDCLRCKVVIEGCQLSTVYRVAVMAIPGGENVNLRPRLSNQLELSLPLDTENIVLPDNELRNEDPDLYSEYVEVREGSGYLPQMDEPAEVEPITHDAIVKQEKIEEAAALLMTEEGLQGSSKTDADEVSFWQNLTSKSTNIDQRLGQLHSFVRSVSLAKKAGGEFIANLEAKVSEFDSRDHNEEEQMKPERSDISDSLESSVDGYQPTNTEQILDNTENVTFDKLGSKVKNIMQVTSRHVVPFSNRQLSIKATDFHEPSSDSLKQSAIEQTSSVSMIQLPVSTLKPIRRPSSNSLSEAPVVSKPPIPLRMLNHVLSPARQVAITNSTKNPPIQGPPLKPIQHVRSNSPHKAKKTVAADIMQSLAKMQHSQLTGASLFNGCERQDGIKQVMHKLEVFFNSLDDDGDCVVDNVKDSTEQSSRTSTSTYNLKVEGIQNLIESDVKDTAGAYESETDPEKIECSVDSGGSTASQFGHQSVSASSDSGSDIHEIDATRGPWVNKMKTVAGAQMAVNYLRRNRQSGDDTSIDMDNADDEIVSVDSVDTLKKKKHKKPNLGKILYRLEREKVKRRRRKGGPQIEVEETADLIISEKQSAVESKPDQQINVLPNDTQAQTAVEGAVMVGGGGDVLPAPSVTVEAKALTSIKVEWNLPKAPIPEYKLLLNVVNVIGQKFEQHVNSDISFECQREFDGELKPAVQHSWNIVNKTTCEIRGIVPSQKYRLFVVANYGLVDAHQTSEIQVSSAVIYYTALGAPDPPVIKVKNCDLYQICVEWDEYKVIEGINLTGFIVLIDGQKLGDILSPKVMRTVIDGIEPGKTKNIQIIATTDHAVGNSLPSRTIQVTCPQVPPPVFISQQPSYKKGVVVIGWEKPTGNGIPQLEDVAYYKIFLDGGWHGEMKSVATADKKGYQYYLTDLIPGQAYEVSVKAYSGYAKFDSKTDHVCCVSESSASNIISVISSAPPQSPYLRIEALNTEGIQLTWQAPQQFGDAVVSGYQVLKNGRLYGSVIPPDVQSVKIKDLELGEKINVQLIALTEHPSGKDGNKKLENGDDWENIKHDQYTACKAGPKLSVHYTGLVQPPSKVWCETVTGHSAFIVWNSSNKPPAHYINPESYEVTWWPGDQPESDINSEITSGDYMLLDNLKSDTTYTVIVEARSTRPYSAYEEDHEGNIIASGHNTLILTASSSKLKVHTAKPPNPPTNIGVIATTCHSIKLAWDPPKENGVEVIGLRLDCVSITPSSEVTTLNFLPDVMSCKIDNLSERTEHIITITAITEEFFFWLPDKDEMKRERKLPQSYHLMPKDSPWLPHTNVIALTSGTDAPQKMTAVKIEEEAIVIRWKPPIVHGSNRLLGQVVRWSEAPLFPQKKDQFTMADHMNLNPGDYSVTLPNLLKGIRYKIVVEAVVSVKTTIDDNNVSLEKDKLNRRTTHVLSDPLFVRTRAPCESPNLLIRGFAQTTIQLAWNKPLLYSVIGKYHDGSPRLLQRSLEGYKLIINGKFHRCLSPLAQTCTLTKCRGGKLYNVVLAAVTCVDEVKKDRKRRFNPDNADAASEGMDESASSNFVSLSPDDQGESDESMSDSVSVTLPQLYSGCVSSMNTVFVPKSVNQVGGGDIRFDWNIEGEAEHIKQFRVNYYNKDRPVVNSKVLDVGARKCTIPILEDRCVYEIALDVITKTESISPDYPRIHVMIPGRADPPEIFLHLVESDEFTIVWGEPRIYGLNRIKSYQLIIDGKQVGKALTNKQHKAVIPCRPNRHYKVNLSATAISGIVSELSNTLFISTKGGGGPPSAGNLFLSEITSADEEHDVIPLKIISVTEDSIHVDWSGYLASNDVNLYKMQWSSMAQPAQKELSVSNTQQHCIITKCFPGTNHFINLLVLGNNNEVLEKSARMVVQTSAPPETPLISLRACNFKYVTVEWDKVSTYGDGVITGYKLFVNGVVEAMLGPEQRTYSYTSGKWCMEYAFQIQALCMNERLHSKPSEPLFVTWPGVKAPMLNQAESIVGNAVRIRWTDPYCTGGVKIKQFKLYCTEEDTDKVVQTVSPIHPDTRVAELKNLKMGTYRVQLEVLIHGTHDLCHSEPISIQPALSPDPPAISVTVVGLEERRRMEKITCDLLNKRDRLLTLKKSNKTLDYQVSAKINESLVLVEDMLDDCFSSLSHYTGHILAHVSWQCPQSNPDISLSGYKVLIDGKQYGCTLNAGFKTVRIKLNLGKPSHRLSMVAVADKPHTNSVESNIVELLTEPFQPFSFYCLSNIHNKESKFPSQGCCHYPDSYKMEQFTPNRPIHQGLLSQPLPAPVCALRDVFDGEYKPMISRNTDRPTAILFWTHWCLPSIKIAGYFCKFAKDHYTKCNFLTVGCGLDDNVIAERQELIHVIMKNGWRDDLIVKHTTGQLVGLDSRALTTPKSTPAKGRKELDLSKKLKIQGVPYLVIMYPQNDIVWQGRYCAFDYSSFVTFLEIMLQNVINREDGVPDETDIDDNVTAEFLDVSKYQKKSSGLLVHTSAPEQPLTMMSLPNNGRITLLEDDEHEHGNSQKLLSKSARPRSAKERHISVNKRPFSASGSIGANVSPKLKHSPYLEKVNSQLLKGKKLRKDRL